MMPCVPSTLCPSYSPAPGPVLGYPMGTVEEEGLCCHTVDTEFVGCVWLWR